MKDSKSILLSPPDVGDDELNSIIAAFKSNWIAPLGPEVSGFEKDLAEYVGVKSAVALSSGTAGIHLALIICGVKPGDVVFCSSFTFAASAFPIKYLGAEPVFIDSELDSWNMCPGLLEDALSKYSKLGKLPKAVIAVDLYGMPCKWDKIIDVCNRYDVPVIQDAAEGLGSNFKGKRLGGFGKLGVLSFNGNKIITTSGGGALVSDDEELVQRARHLATQAREPFVHYEHTEVGYNYRMSNLLAALGRAQLRALDKKVEKRRAHFEEYKKHLVGITGISFLPEPEGCFSNRWLTCVVFDSEVFPIGTRERVRLCLEKENIESRPLWKPMHMQPAFAKAMEGQAHFKGCAAFLNGVSEKLFMSGLCLPSGSGLEVAQVERVCGVVKAGLG